MGRSENARRTSFSNRPERRLAELVLRHVQSNPRRPSTAKLRRKRTNGVQKNRIRRTGTRLNAKPASANGGTWAKPCDLRKK